MDYKAKYDEIMTRARERERKLGEIGPDLVPHVRTLRQKEERERIIADTKRQTEELRLSVEKRIREVEAGILQACCPLMVGSTAAERAIGSTEYLAAMSVGIIVPDKDWVQWHWDLKRFYFLTHVKERVDQIVNPQTPTAIEEKRAFLDFYKKLFSERWGELPEERKALLAVRQRIEYTLQNLAVGQIGAIAPGEYPGSFAPSVLTK